MKKIRLFIIPHAGGSASGYYRLKPYLSSEIELCPIELAGRGDRCEEGLYDTLESAVDDVFDQIKNKLPDLPYALFGHSMGSVIIYELYYKIREERLTEPKHMFFSGSGAPDVVRENKIAYHKLPMQELKRSMGEFGYTPDIIFDNEELRDYFLPILMSDFRITENYACAEKMERIGCPISAFCGKEEDISSNELMAWKNHTSIGCGIYKFEGSHFFIFEDIKNVVRTINSVLV